MEWVVKPELQIQILSSTIVLKPAPPFMELNINNRLLIWDHKFYFAIHHSTYIQIKDTNNSRSCLASGKPEQVNLKKGLFETMLLKLLYIVFIFEFVISGACDSQNRHLDNSIHISTVQSIRQFEHAADQKHIGQNSNKN